MWRSNTDTHRHPSLLSYQLIRWSFDPVNATDLQQTWTGDDGWAGQRRSHSQTRAHVHTHTRTLVPLPAPPWQSQRFEKFIAVRRNVELSPLAHKRKPPSPRPARRCQMDTRSHTPARLIPNCPILVILTVLVSVVTLTWRYWSIQVKKKKKCMWPHLKQ